MESTSASSDPENQYSQKKLESTYVIMCNDRLIEGET